MADEIRKAAEEAAGSHWTEERDNWYSCPASGDCSDESRDPSKCDCGRSARVQAIESAIRAAVETETARLREIAAAWRDYGEAIRASAGPLEGSKRRVAARRRLVALGELEEG